jgi:hypothetical protein
MRFERVKTGLVAPRLSGAAVAAVVNLLLDHGFDPVLLVHDNDAKGIQAARDTKAEWQRKNPNIKLQSCPCGGEVTDGEDKQCDRGSLCRGVVEQF